MKKAEKQFFVENLTAELKSASSVVLVDYAGLSVKLQQELKKRLKKADATMSVIKNTLFKIAGTNAKYPKESMTDTVLAGPTAVVITERDPIAPLQILSKFSEEFGLPHFKVGIVEGSFQDKDSLAELSKLPGKDAIIAQVVGSIASPLYALTGTLNANMQNLISVLKQASEK